MNKRKPLPLDWDARAGGRRHASAGAERFTGVHLRILAIVCLLSFVLILPSCGGGRLMTPEVMPPAITAHPSNITVTAGQPATFTVIAHGSPPLSYQWQKNDAAIAGATSASYRIAATASSDDGSRFKVVVNNSAGSVASNPATLNVSAPSVAPSITQQPSDTSVNVGQTATFTVVASGSSPLAYQWQKNDLPITAATSASYTTPATRSSDNGSKFNVVVSNSAGSTTSNAVTLTVRAGSISVTISPKRASAAASGQTRQFTATVSGDSQNLGVTWTVDGIAGGNASVGTVTGGGLYTAASSGGMHTIQAASVADPTKNDSGAIAVTDLQGVFTYHNNQARDGTNTQEYELTPSNVAVATFGKLFSCPTDGAVYTQPLWVPNVSVNTVKHNIVFVATAHDSVYAFDAEISPCSQLWQASLLDSAHGAGAGETSVPNTDLGGSNDIQPEIGIIGTPVVDLSTGTLFVVSKSEGPIGTFHQRLHALDVASGSEKFGGPANISASVVGAGYDSSGATVTFNPGTQNQRSALALLNGVVYIVWASHGDVDAYHGWLIGYSASNLSQVAAYNTTADGRRGGIWMAGGAPAADSANTLYVSTGNGTMDHDSLVTPNTDLGDSVLKITTTSGLSLSDWFSPFNQTDLDMQDADLGAGGVLLLPDQSGAVPHLLVTGGKEGRLYLINRDSMGQFCASCTATTGDTNVVQNFMATNLIFDTPAFWQNGMYLGGVSDKLSLFPFDPVAGKFNTIPASQSPTAYSFPGTTPSISSQGSTQGIVWAIDSSQYGIPENAGGPAVLHAYDATNLATELWSSSQAPNLRDQAGPAVKFTVPTVANGKVYVGTRNTVEVYGLLSQ